MHVHLGKISKKLLWVRIVALVLVMVVGLQQVLAYQQEESGTILLAGVVMEILCGIAYLTLLLERFCENVKNFLNLVLERTDHL